MKPIIIKPKQLKKELYFWLTAFGIAFLLNIFSIIKYQTNWKEIVTQSGYVFALSIIIYLVIVLFRGIVNLFGKKH